MLYFYLQILLKTAAAAVATMMVAPTTEKQQRATRTRTAALWHLEQEQK